MKYAFKCPHCGGEDFWRFASVELIEYGCIEDGVFYVTDEDNTQHNYETAQVFKYVCAGCKHEWVSIDDIITTQQK